MPRPPREPRDVAARLAALLLKARPERAPGLAVAALRAQFPGARCDVAVRQRRGDRRSWTPMAWAPRDQAPLDLGDGPPLPPSGVVRGRIGETAPLPGASDLAARGMPERMTAVIRTPEVKAILSVARAQPFSPGDQAVLAAVATELRGPLATELRLERFRRGLQRARFLQRVLADLTRTLDVPEIAVTLFRRLRERVPFGRLVLVEPKGDGQDLTAWVVDDAHPGRADALRITGRVASMARRRPLSEARVTGRLAAAPPDPWLDEAASDGFASMLVLPLLMPKREGGALLLLSRSDGDLRAEHLPLLWHLSRSLASAVEKARLYRDASERTRLMTALYEVGQVLNSPLDTAGVTDRVLSILHEAFRFRHSAVLTLETEPDGEWLVMQASRGYAPTGEGGFRMRVGDRGVTSRAVRTGRIVYVPDVRQDPHYVQGVESGRSEVALPLMAGGRVVGVLDVESTKLNAFTADDLEALKLFSTQVALALERARLFDDIRRQAMTDSLTGLLNQRYFKQKVDRELERSRRTERPFVLVLIDIDDFKRINDEHGHVAGDAVIAAMGEVLRSRIRSIDAAARFGGDEFAMILSEADLAQGMRVAQDVLAEARERRPAGVAVSLSMGVAEWRRELFAYGEIVNAADQALYRAKALGKGRVEAAAATGEASAP